MQIRNYYLQDWHKICMNMYDMYDKGIEWIPIDWNHLYINSYYSNKT